MKIQQPTDLAAQLKSITEAPFRALNNVLHPDTEPSGIVKNLLAAPNSGLWTAMVVLLDDGNCSVRSNTWVLG